MTEELQEPEAGQQGRSFLGRVLRTLIGLFLSTILGIALGVTAFQTLPYLYRDLTEPAADNARRISTLERNLESTRSQAETSRRTSLDRLSEMEQALGSQARALEDLQGKLGELASDQAEQSRMMRSLSALKDRVNAQDRALDDLETRMNGLESSLAHGQTPLDRIQRNLLLTRAMVAVMRARLWLIENNLGSATLEVQAARELVLQSIGAEPEEVVPSIHAVADRLQLTLAELETAPLVAGDDLEIAWKLLSAAMASEELTPSGEAPANP